MIKDGEPVRTEFWLKKYPSQPEDNNETLNYYRVALGDLINGAERKTFTPRLGSHSPDFWNKTGHVGFMDITVRDEYVPKKDAIPFPNPHHYPDLEDMYTDCETVRALVVLTIGIEPEYRGQGHARVLSKRAEELAIEWGLFIVVASMIENPIMKGLNQRMGYISYDRGTYAIKRLNRKE